MGRKSNERSLWTLSADNISLALTGTDLTWIQENKPEIIDYVLVKGTYASFMDHDSWSIYQLIAQVQINHGPAQSWGYFKNDVDSILNLVVYSNKRNTNFCSSP